MTFEKRFEQIKKELEKRDSKYLPTDLAVQVTMDDEDCGGTFYVANVEGVFEVEPYDYWDNTLYINVMAADLMDMLTGKLDGTDALFRGLVTGNGNLDHGLAILTMPKKKAAAKKPAEKKAATPKKTAEKKAAAPKKTAVKKAAAPKKTAEKKAAAPKKTAEKKAAAPKKTAEKKAAAPKKTAEKKAAAPKKTAEKKAAAPKKTAEKKAAAPKKAAEKKTAAKKTAAKK